MRPEADPRFLAAVRGSHRTVVSATATAPGGTPVPLRVNAGGVDSDRGRTVRRTLGLTVLADPATADVLEPWGTVVAVRRGVVVGGSPVLCGLGVFRVDDVDETHVETKGRRVKALALSGGSLESFVADAEFPVPRQSPPTSCLAAIRELITEAVPFPVQIRVDARIADAPLPSVVWAEQRLGAEDAALDQLARAVGAERPYCDGDGVFVIAPPPTLDDPAVWVVDAGGVMVDARRRSSREGVTPVVVVTSDRAGEEAPFPPVVVTDDQPGSRTNPLTFGEVVHRHANPILTTHAAAFRAGRTILADRLGLAVDISWSAVPNPGAEVGDVMALDGGDGPVRYVVETLGMPVVSGVMSGQARHRQVT